MNKILALMQSSPRVTTLEDGGEIHGVLQNGVPVHIKISYGELCVAFDDVPAYGSEPISPEEAYRKIKRVSQEGSKEDLEDLEEKYR